MVAVVIFNGAGAMVRLNPAFALPAFESFTTTFTVNAPALAGVPVIAPVDDEILNPFGNPVADHVYGGVPPVAESEAE